MKLFDRLTQHAWTTLVSLPRNDVELAHAALRGGAQGLKIHINVEHFASGTRFGAFQEERETIAEIMKVARVGEVSVGIVPGTINNFATRDEFAQLAAMGVDYFDAYPFDAPAWTLTQPYLSVMLAAHFGATNPEMLALRGMGMTLCEASIINHDDYGQPLTTLDLARYRSLSATLRTLGIECPVIVPSQKKLMPDDVAALMKTSCKGVLLGAIVVGREADSIEAQTRAFVDASRDL